MIDIAGLLAKLVAVGTPPELVADVARLASQMESDADRRERDRIRKQNQRSRPRMSADVTGQPLPSSPKKENLPEPLLRKNTLPPPPLSLSSDSDGGAYAHRPSIDLFEEFWREYPKRDGANPRKPAERKFLAIVRSGTPAETVIGGARRYRKQLEGKNQVGTVYVAQAQTWLNQQRWVDEQQGTLPLLAVVPKGPSAYDLELIAEYRRKHGGAHV